MATASPSGRAAIDPAEAARLHFILRFSFGTTAAFVVCEWMGWQPSALAPVLTGRAPRQPARLAAAQGGARARHRHGDCGVVRILPDASTRPNAIAPVRSDRAHHVSGLCRPCPGESSASADLAPDVHLRRPGRDADDFGICRHILRTACEGHGTRRHLHLDQLCHLAAAFAEESRSAGRSASILPLPLQLSERRSSFRSCWPTCCSA